MLITFELLKIRDYRLILATKWRKQTIIRADLAGRGLISVVYKNFKIFMCFGILRS